MGTSSARKSKIVTSTTTAENTGLAHDISTKPALVSIPDGSAFVVGHAQLNAALARMQSICDKRSTMPMLANVLIRSNGALQNTTTIVGTDLNITLTINLASRNTSSWATTLNAHKLASLVKALPDGDVTVDRNPNARLGATIRCGRVVAKLDGMHERDYPKVPDIGDTAWSCVDAKTLRDMIESVAFSVCKDDTRFHLNGAFFESTGTIATLTSTDGHRLTKARQPLPNAPVLTKGVIIPIKALTEIRKLLAGADLKTCDIAFKAPHVFVKCGNATLAIKTIDAQFPPYEQVIPRGYTKLVTVDKAELIEACKRGKLLGCETRGLAISATKGALTLSSDNPDIGEVKESIDAEYEGADAQIGLNPVYLLELLAQIDGKRVTLGFDKPLDPILVRDTDDVVSRSLSESALVGVVMPMRIK